MLDWDDVRYFLSVARSGSLSGAARALGVAQPTVGRRLTAFEAQLGAELFERTPFGQALTPSGQRLLLVAERMEEQALTFERVGAGRDAGLKGHVRISASEWLVQRMLGPLLVPFTCSHPELELELCADTRHLNLARREADIAIRPSAFQQPEVIQRDLASLTFGLYASDAYLFRHGMPDFSRQCEGHFLIAMSEALGKVPDVEFIPAIAARARVVVRTNGREPMAVMAAAGVGITCLPRFVGDSTAGLRYLPTPQPEPRRRLYLGYHADARGTPRLKACVAFLVQAIPRLQSALDPSAAAPRR